MSEEKKVVEQKPVAIDPALLVEILKEVKKPYVDPEIEERKRKQRIALREERKRSEENRQRAIDMCGHMREDNTSAIAWMTTEGPDGRPFTRGVCQRCNGLFTPDHPDFMRLLRIPTGKLGIIWG